MIKIISVSNRLPVVISDGEVKKPSGGLVSALDAVAGGEYVLKRVGWTGSSVDDPGRREEIDRLLREEFDAIPVFLSNDEAAGYYEGFSNSSLWPLLHYMPTKLRYEPQWWDAYRAVNRRFAQTIASVAEEGDLVWIHDYHLMLVPAMLKQMMPSLKIGFFLHTPFPSYEVFRCHPRRRELLEGLLGADQIGFHTFGYLRHFRSTVLRLLGIDSDITRIHQASHTTHLGIYPIGINATQFDAVLKSPEYRAQLAELRAAHEGKRVVLSVERMDYTKGIPRRLEAIDLFLEHFPDRERILFMFVSIPSRETVGEYQELREEIEARIGRINGKYATIHNSPIHFIHGSVDVTKLCALYSLAEVQLVTPLIDGMNLVAKEYVACQTDGNGVLILSEFAGAAEELFNSLVVNPYDTQGVAEALVQALEMPSEERAERMRPMRERVMKYDAASWARRFIRDLAAQTPRSAPRGGDGAQLSEAKGRITDSLHAGGKTAFFLDYDGTLREIELNPAAARPNAAVRELLDHLRDVPNLDVTIVSGRRAREMEAWLGSYPFGLIAEHGADIRRPGERQWDRLDRNVNYSWKDEILPVLRLYEASTPGSFVEEKRTGLVWHYRKADPEFGTWKANQLAEELGSILANEPVQIRHGKKIIEVAATQVSKGAAVNRLLDEQRYGVALCAGDDQTDESMFQLEAPNLITIKVGSGDTHAQLRLPDPRAFRRFLTDAVSEQVLASAG